MAAYASRPTGGGAALLGEQRTTRTRRNSQPFPSAPITQRRRSLCVQATGKGPDGLGDFGARDPFAGELATNFGEKSYGLADTEHRILFPSGLNDVVGLAAQSCQPLSAEVQALDEKDARELLKRVVGWRLLSLDPETASQGSSALKLQGQWRVRDESAGQELQRRIGDLAQQEGQEPQIKYDEGSRSVVAELVSQAAGGLTVNDFIFAAKIDKLEIKDLVAKARFWA